jgi:hypothetical protein
MQSVAQQYLRAGLCVLPAFGAEKRPALTEWKQYQERLPTEDEIQKWFKGNDPDAACCLITGAVSGNLELLDFDLGGELYDNWAKNVCESNPGLIDRLVIETSQSGGFHVVYRCQATVGGNMKLAQRRLIVPDGNEVEVKGKKYKPRRDTFGNWHVILSLIETRGEGGLFLCHPSPRYELLQRHFTDLPVLSETERETLLEAAWALNEYFPEPIGPQKTADTTFDLRPGDEFNERGDIREILCRHGWTLAKQGDNEYWRRPGKTSGSSATLKDRVFYVFSTNAAPFEPDRAYSPFTLYALLEHHGDFSTAASVLRGQGYGDAPSLGTIPTPSKLNMDVPLTVRQLVGQFPKLRTPVVHGLLREGETMNLISASKVGKSFLATDLALAVATGRPWLEQFDCERGDVLILDNELHPETSANRIPKVAAARQIPFDAYADHVLVKNLRGQLQNVYALGEYFKLFQPGRFKIVILDALYRSMPKNTDENDNGTMAEIYNHIDRYADQMRCAFILVHHSTKGNQSAKSVTDIGAGAGSQSRATDTHLVLRMHEQMDAVVLEAAVRSWPPVAAKCMRWNFPVWIPAPELDPTQLRQEGKRRASSAAADVATDNAEDEVIKTAEQFVEELICAQPQLRELILEEAEQAGLSRTRAKQFIQRAEGKGLIHSWNMDRNRIGYATQPPPESIEKDSNGEDEISKREIVEQLILQNSDLSSKEIAEQCGATKQYVNRIRKELES